MEEKSLVINGRKVRFAEVEIDWENKKSPVRIKKLSFGEMLDLNQLSAKVNYGGAGAQIIFDARAMSENCLLKGIIEAPFPVNLQSIRDLDKETGEYLVTVFNELNSPAPAKKEI